MSDKETKIIVGDNGTGTERKYKFVLAGALEGVTVIHDYSSMLVAALPQITALFASFAKVEGEEDSKILKMAAEDFKSGGGPVVDCIRLLPQIVTSARLVGLCGVFLAGAEIDDQKCGDDGMCTLFARRPHQVYPALFWALVANYPDYILPFLGGTEAPAVTTAAN